MNENQVYDATIFQEQHKVAYEKGLEEAKRLNIQIEGYYFSQYLVTSFAGNKTIGELLYILDDGTDNTSLNIEIVFDANGEIESVDASVSTD